MHSDSLKQLGESFQAEVQPMVVEVEGRTLQLKGTAEEQYHEWRRLLKELYENETGLPVQTPAPAPASEAAYARLERRVARSVFNTDSTIASCWRAGRNCLQDSSWSGAWAQAAAVRYGLHRTASAAASSRVKILAAELTQDVAAVAALQRECEQLRHARSSEHPARDGLHRSARHVWIAMDYASGGDLSQLRGRGCTEILRAAVPIANALAHAHRAGIVHRDVKPANVLFMSDGTPRLSDFGVALAVASLPASNAGRGSPYSMSPQQTRGCGSERRRRHVRLRRDVVRAVVRLSSVLPGCDSRALRFGAACRPAGHPCPPLCTAGASAACAVACSDRPADMQAVERELNAVLAELPAPAMIEHNVTKLHRSQSSRRASVRPRRRANPCAASGVARPRRTQRRRAAASRIPSRTGRGCDRAGIRRLSSSCSSCCRSGSRTISPPRYAPAAAAVQPQASATRAEEGNRLRGARARQTGGRGPARGRSTSACRS